MPPPSYTQLSFNSNFRIGFLLPVGSRCHRLVRPTYQLCIPLAMSKFYLHVELNPGPRVIRRLHFAQLNLSDSMIRVSARVHLFSS